MTQLSKERFQVLVNQFVYGDDWAAEYTTFDELADVVKELLGHINESQELESYMAIAGNRLWEEVQAYDSDLDMDLVGEYIDSLPENELQDWVDLLNNADEVSTDARCAVLDEFIDAFEESIDDDIHI